MEKANELSKRVKELEIALNLVNKRVRKLEVELEYTLLKTRQNRVVRN